MWAAYNQVHATKFICVEVLYEPHFYMREVF
jgi:hypothetical protein